MWLAIALLIHYSLSVLLYFLWKTDSLLAILIFVSPFLYSSASFFQLKKSGFKLRYNYLNYATFQSLAFYGFLILAIPLHGLLPEFLSYDQYSLILPVILSFAVFFILNKQFNITTVLYFLMSFIFTFYFIKSGVAEYLFFAFNSNRKGDTMVISLIASNFIAHLLFIVANVFCWKETHSNLAK